MTPVNSMHEAVYRQAQEFLRTIGPIDPNEMAITIACRAIIAERQRCAAIADAIAKETGDAGLSHPEDSESRGRCFSRSRTAQRIADEIRGV